MKWTSGLLNLCVTIADWCDLVMMSVTCGFVNISYMHLLGHRPGEPPAIVGQPERGEREEGNAWLCDIDS